MSPCIGRQFLIYCTTREVLPGGFDSIPVHFRQLLLLASLITQLVKNPHAMQRTLVRFLGWEDPLEKG